MFHAIFPSFRVWTISGETIGPLGPREPPGFPRGFSLTGVLFYVPLGQASRLCRGWRQPSRPRLLVARPWRLTSLYAAPLPSSVPRNQWPRPSLSETLRSLLPLYGGPLRAAATLRAGKPTRGRGLPGLRKDLIVSTYSIRVPSGRASFELCRAAFRHGPRPLSSNHW